MYPVRWNRGNGNASVRRAGSSCGGAVRFRRARCPVLQYRSSKEGHAGASSRWSSQSPDGTRRSRWPQVCRPSLPATSPKPRSGHGMSNRRHSRHAEPGERSGLHHPAPRRRREGHLLQRSCTRILPRMPARSVDRRRVARGNEMRAHEAAGDSGDGSHGACRRRVRHGARGRRAGLDCVSAPT